MISCRSAQIALEDAWKTMFITSHTANSNYAG